MVCLYAHPHTNWQLLLSLSATMLPFKITFLSDLYEFTAADAAQMDVGFRLDFFMDNMNCPP